MADNRELATLLERMAKVLELTGANRFRVIAHQRGARAIKDLTTQATALAADGIGALTEIEGIGKGLAEKIIEYADTGKIEEHDKLVASVPPGVLAMLDISGLGPKTVKTLWEEGGVETIDQLKAKIDAGELTGLPRIGDKLLQKVRKSIDFAEKSSDRVQIGVAMSMAHHFIEMLSRVKGVKKVDYAGSLRRGRETIGDVDILAACDDPAALSEAFRTDVTVEQVIAAGETKSSVRTVTGLQVDLRVVDIDRYGAALMYFSGSKEHNVALRQRAIDRKLSLNEYGLWEADDADKQDTATPVAARTEDEIYRALDLPFIPPELREDRGEIKAAEQGALPQLVTLRDVRSELHAHTTASDGKLSIEQLAKTARERGFHTIAVTDHSVSQAQASGLTNKRLAEHIEAIRAVDAKLDGIRILAGSEVDILATGKLDYPDSLLDELDIVIASPHAALTQEPAKATARLIKAIEHRAVHIIGHVSGRLIGRREGLNPDYAKLFEAAAKCHTAFEINANPWRLDIRDRQAKAAIDAGVMLAINTDAHSAGDFDHLRFGILTARRAWAEPKHILNCLDAEGLVEWLKNKR